MRSDRLLEYCLGSWHLAAHCATISSSHATFKFQLFLGPPLYTEKTQVVWDKVLQVVWFKEYIINMTMPLGKDRKCATPSVTAIHTTVTWLTARNEYVGHKFYMDSFRSSQGTVRPNRKGMPKNFGRKKNLKMGDLRLRWKVTWQPLYGRANEM
jgi:hypothetical protein